MPEPRGTERYPRPLYRDEVENYPRPPQRRSPPNRLQRAEPEEDPRPPQRRSPPGRGQWGALPGRLGVSIVFGAAAIGMLVTLLTHREPGDLLGAFLVAGTIIAALAVHPRVTYLIIPAPALAYLVAGSIAGLIHDRAADTSRTALAVSGVQWIAGGFLAMTAATVLAAAITAVRWPRRGGAQRGPRPDRVQRGPRPDRSLSEPGYEEDDYRLSPGFRPTHSPRPDN